ncbi:uncharacterized protein LOC144626486 [Crassostrea virginica]
MAELYLIWCKKPNNRSINQELNLETLDALSGTCNGMGSNSFVYQHAPSNFVCYWVSTIQTNIIQANAVCLGQGGFLALIADSTADAAVTSFLDSQGLRSTEVYLGYDVDTTSNYRLTTLSGQEQTYKNFYSTNINSADWHCVSTYISSWFPEQCNNAYYFLCSNISNLAAPPSTSTVIQTTTDYSESTTTEIQTTIDYSESTTTEIQTTTDYSESTTTDIQTTTDYLESTTTEIQTTTDYSESTTTEIQTTTDYSESTTTDIQTTTDYSESTTTTTTTPTAAAATTTTTTATTATTTSSTCICPTNCVVSYTATINSTEELNAKIAEIKKEIEVEKSTLSSNIRKKTSADDPRPSAKSVGFIGIVIIAIVIGGIVALDLPRILIAVKDLGVKVSRIFKK